MRGGQRIDKTRGQRIENKKSGRGVLKDIGDKGPGGGSGYRRRDGEVKGLKRTKGEGERSFELK